MMLFRATGNYMGNVEKKALGQKEISPKAGQCSLLCWSFIVLMPGSCHKCRTAQVGGLDTQTWREQGKAEFGIQKGIQKKYRCSGKMNKI